MYYAMVFYFIKNNIISIKLYNHKVESLNNFSFGTIL